MNQTGPLLEHTFLLLGSRFLACFLFTFPICLQETLDQNEFDIARDMERTSSRTSSFSAATTTPSTTGNALLFLNSNPVCQRGEVQDDMATMITSTYNSFGVIKAQFLRYFSDTFICKQQKFNSIQELAL